MRVFLDTNVVVSALATRGLSADLLHVILAEHELVLGETVLGETSRVLRDKFRLPRAQVEGIDAFLRRQATVVRGERKRIEGLDAADAMIVAEALAGQADALVSGDSDLLDPSKPPVRIVSPRGLWELLRRVDLHH